MQILCWNTGKLIVPVSLFEGYANFAMNYTGKFEQIANNKNRTNETLANLLICMLSMYNPILSIFINFTELVPKVVKRIDNANTANLNFG